MLIAYLILAHNSPSHLRRLISALDSPSARIFVHIDGKSDIEIFKGVSGNAEILNERHKVYWGDFSQVDAILALIRASLRSEPPIERFVLLSGVDYPIRSNAYIESFFNRYPSLEFINLVEMPNDAMGKPLARIDNFWPRKNNYFWSRMEMRVRRLAVRAKLLKVERDHRPYLKDIKPYGGGTWWALTRDACEYLLNYVEHRPDVVRFFSNTVLPDELMIHTILGNSKFSSHVRRNLTYTDWRKGGPSPSPIGAQHVAEFNCVDEVIDASGPFGSGELLFARKLSDESSAVVDQLELMRIDKDMRSADSAIAKMENSARP